MATFLWGNVFYKDHLAGVLREESGTRYVFEYDGDYVKDGHPAIAHTLPKTHLIHMSQGRIHPFFDNLVAEGWLEQAQTRLLGKRASSRFELLLAFGFDCPGAVYIRDPNPTPLTELLLDHGDERELAILASRASLSGVQPKLAILERDGAFFPTKAGELSTHIAKFSSANYADLVMNEYATMAAFRTLVGDDDVVALRLGQVHKIDGHALIIPRFDRENGARIHFEEFNQLLGKPSSAKYEGAYREMSTFLRTTPTCIPAENYRLFMRILAGVLLGNTDMHLKNFAMMHTVEGLRLSPSYDQVAAILYGYKHLALGLAGATDRPMGSLRRRHLLLMGEEFELPRILVEKFLDDLGRRLPMAKEAVEALYGPSDLLKEQIVSFMETRWRGTFA